MENSGLEPFRTSVHANEGTYTVLVWCNNNQLELEIEEPSAKKSDYVWDDGRLISTEYDPNKFRYYEIPSLPASATVPTHKDISEEIKRVAAKAVEQFLRFEQENEGGRS